ncbi:helix-turn-helix domain-containing protein [Embleya sp. MST-111070]|uniref:helix-turn-helix domain-containing protein n=1 Tax=Embleya sp. MST-111070 TaxID=3398231 RepID=UPI003F734AC3
MTAENRDIAAQMLGAQMQALREDLGLSRLQVADYIGNSESTVRSWERGARFPDARTFAELDTLLKARGVVSAAAEKLRSHPKISPRLFGEYAAKEADCLSLCSYNTMVLPGLLQTEEYARATLDAFVPPHDDTQVDKWTAKRLARQPLLTRRNPPELSFVIEEHVLRRPLGGKPALRRQLEHIVECAKLRYLSLQVMPQGTEEHSGLEGPMILLRTCDGQDLGYMEGQGGDQWISEPEHVAILAQRYGRIRSQALWKDQSVELIEGIAKSL